MFELDGVGVAYIDGDEILRDISLTFAAGESVVLTGASGCGKSTLLRLLLGGIPWQRGHYYFHNEQVNSGNIARVRTSCGFVAQESDLAGATVREGLMRPYQFAAYRDKHFPEDELQRLLATFGLNATLLESAPAKLSGGQRQRLNIIRALLLQHQHSVTG